MLLLVEVYSRLPIKARQMDPESTEKIISDYFPDTMALVDSLNSLVSSLILDANEYPI